MNPGKARAAGCAGDMEHEVLGHWPGLVAAGLMTALVVLAAVAGRLHIAVGSALVVVAVASLAGAAGARAWYVMLQRGKASGIVTRGLCIHGFVTGAVAAGIPALLLARVPVGTFFDAATSGLFFAMAIGRQGASSPAAAQAASPHPAGGSGHPTGTSGRGGCRPSSLNR